MSSEKVSLPDQPYDSSGSIMHRLRERLISESLNYASDTETSNTTLLPEKAPNSAENLNGSNDIYGSSIVVLENNNEKSMNNEKSISGLLTLLTEDNISLSVALNKIEAKIEERLSGLLLENQKLKCNLTQKDKAHRKRFHTIVILEKEIVQVCENYRQKFPETKDLIVSLKNDKADLLASLELYKTRRGTNENNGAAEREPELIETIQCLTQSRRDMEAHYFESQAKLEKVQKLHATELEVFSEQLKRSHIEIEEMKKKISLPDDWELVSLVNDKCKKDLELKYLMEIVALMKQDTRLNAVQDPTLPEETVRENNPANDLNNTENYNKKLQEFIKCFVEKCIRYLKIEEFPNQCTNITNIFSNAKLPTNNIFVNDSVKVRKEKLVDYRKMLIDDQLQIIKDEKTSMTVQRQFLKALSDYDNFVDRLETLKTEYMKLSSESSSINESNFNNLAEIERCLVEEKRIVDSESPKLIEERTKIEIEKQMILEERELLEAERNAVLEEKRLILDQIAETRIENERLKKDADFLRRKLKHLKDNNTAFLNNELALMRTEFVKATVVLEKWQSYDHDNNATISNNELALIRAEFVKAKEELETSLSYGDDNNVTILNNDLALMRFEFVKAKEELENMLKTCGDDALMYNVDKRSVYKLQSEID